MELGVANLTDIDPVTVEAVLTYHVISGNVTSDNIPTGAVTTLGGDMMIDASKLTIVGFPKNRTVINSNLLTLNSNCHNENKQV